MNQPLDTCSHDREPLSPSALEAEAGALLGWTCSIARLSKPFTFQDFKQAMVFVNQVAGLAEAMDHHPDIEIYYNTVILGLATHSCGGVTRLDTTLAKRINACSGEGDT
jgi:4a-hydroxytetrahydrobiopterin dehydratase